MCNACAVDEIELQQRRHVRTASSSTIHVAHAIAMWRTAHFNKQHQQQQWQVDDFATAAAAAAPKLGFLFLPFCQVGGMAIIHTRGGMRQTWLNVRL